VDGLTDYAGTLHEPVGEGARIISLVPSITELLFDLNLADHLVGRTHYCVHPKPEIDDVPSVGGTKKVVLERVRELAPTHVLVNVDENTKDQVEAIRGLGPSIVVTHPIDPEDNLALFHLIGGLFGRADEAQALAGEYKSAVAELQAAAAGLPERNVLYFIWKEPWMTVSQDTYISRFLSLANWRTQCHNPTTRYPEVDVTPELLGGTDLVLFSSEPYAFTPSDIDDFRATFPCSDTRLLPIDGEMTSWYGSRAIKGVRYLQQLAESVV
jgi:ABC-type Fe3+-hydroxamate transport system substrate-binding protein